MPPHSLSRARWSLVAAALLFATGGPAIKACALTSWQVACLRSGVAAITLLIFLRPSWESFHWRTLLVGAAHGTTMILFVVANKLTTATHAIFLQNSSILYVLLLAPLLLKEKLRRHDAVVLALVVVGLAFLFSANQAAGRTAPDPMLGNALAAVSGVSWAFTVIGMRWLGSRAEPAAGTDGARPGDAALGAVICGNLVAFTVCLVPALPIATPRPLDIGLIAFLGTIQIALAYVFVARGLAGVTALEGSLILLVEPVLNPLLTWLVHAEEPHPRAMLGAAAILAATLAKAWCERDPARTGPPSAPP